MIMDISLERSTNSMETLGEHKALLDRLVSRLRSRSEVYSAGWEKKEAPQEDF